MKILLAFISVMVLSFAASAHDAETFKTYFQNLDGTWLTKNGDLTYTPVGEGDWTLDGSLSEGELFIELSGTYRLVDDEIYYVSEDIDGKETLTLLDITILTTTKMVERDVMEDGSYTEVTLEVDQSVTPHTLTRTQSYFEKTGENTWALPEEFSLIYTHQ